MAKHGLRVMDSDLHVIEPRTLWDDYLDPGSAAGSRRCPATTA